MTTKEDIKFLHEQIKMLATDVQVLKAYNLMLIEILSNSDKHLIKNRLQKIDSLHASHQIQYEKDIENLIQAVFPNQDENH